MGLSVLAPIRSNTEDQTTNTSHTGDKLQKLSDLIYDSIINDN